MARRAKLALAVIVMAFVAGGCLAPETPIPLVSGPTVVPSPPIQSPTSTPLIQISTPLSTAPVEAGTISAPGADPASYVQAAIAMLATTLNVSPSSITLVGVPMPVVWNDSSLGCPQEGQTYQPVVTQGYLITLAVGDATYEVHTDLAGAVILCSNGSPSLGTSTAPDPVVVEFIAQAKKDLSTRLGVPPDDVVLVRSEAVDWSDTSLGCAEPGQNYEPGPISGYRLILVVGEDYYEYHTDLEGIHLCENPTE